MSEGGDQREAPRAITSGGGATAQDPVAAARALGPRIRALAPEIDRERRLPAELADAMRDAGLFHLLVPRSAGGNEIDPVTASRAVEEVSAADGSAGWCVMVAAQIASYAGFMAEEYAREIWGSGGIVAGTARPNGRATPVQAPADGAVISGRWPFASGSSHATCFSAECVVYDGDEPRRDVDGNPVIRTFFVPRADVTIHDTWHTLGLRGTASNDFSVDGAFVPAGRLARLFEPPVHPWPVFRAHPLVYMNHGSQALGVASAAIAAAGETAAGKRAWGGARSVREEPWFQGVVAEATVLAASARHHLYATAEDLWRATPAGVEDTSLLRARVRLAASHAVAASVRAVDLMHSAVGTASIFRDNPLERHFRDIHVAAAHVMIGRMTYEAAGRVELGMAPDFPYF